MTDKTKKILVSLLLCIVVCATVVLGVFAFIPNFKLDEINAYYYQSPFTAIQKSVDFTQGVKATYTVKIDDDAEENTPDKVVGALQSRLAKAYGYYDCPVSYDADAGTITVLVPITNNKNDNYLPATSILSGVTVNGNVEILNTTYSSASYSETSVLLKQEHFTGVGIRKLINEGTTFFICSVGLTGEGRELANQLAENTAYVCAIDGAVNTWVYRSGNDLQVYYVGNDNDSIIRASRDASALSAYIQTGALQATLTQKGSTENVRNNVGWVYMLVLGLVVLASLIFFAVRYKVVGIIPMVTQLLACFVFIFFGALVRLEIFNVWMGIGVILAYAFATFFSAFEFERVRKLMLDGKNYSVARYQALAFNRDNRKHIFISLISHVAFLVFGIIMWVIPTGVTAPLGNAIVYGAVLSFIVTFCLNRLFARMIGVFFEAKRGTKRAVAKK